MCPKKRVASELMKNMPESQISICPQQGAETRVGKSVTFANPPGDRDASPLHNKHSEPAPGFLAKEVADARFRHRVQARNLERLVCFHGRVIRKL